MTKFELQSLQTTESLATLLKQFANSGKIAQFDLNDSQAHQFICVLEPRTTITTETCPAMVLSQEQLTETLDKNVFEFERFQLFIKHKTVTAVSTQQGTLVKYVDAANLTEDDIYATHTPYLKDLTNQAQRFGNKGAYQAKSGLTGKQYEFAQIATLENTMELVWREK